MTRRGLALLAVLVAVMAGCGSDDGSTATSGPAPSSTTATTEAPTTTTPPTTAAPTTAPPTTAAPTTAPPTTEPPPPVSVVVAGDSVAYTIAEGAPPEIPGVTSVEGATLIGCGLLTSGPRPPAAVAAGAPANYESCAGAIDDNNAHIVAVDPEVVLLALGAWERPDHEREGRTVGPDDPAWTQEMARLLGERIDQVAGGGAKVAVWVDPCAREEDMRRRQAWFRDEVIAPAVAARPAAQAIDPSEIMCVDGAPRTDIEGVGDPRPDDGQHLSEEGAAWLWTTWLGPALAAVGAR